jgi:mono/diheme cytochrome c family protein
MRKLTDLFSFAAILGVPVVLGALTLPMLANPPAAHAADAPGKALFLAQKCNMCHGIESQQIARTSKSDKMQGPDLSNVGGAHLAPWIASYLKKEQADAEGKKHGKGWTGSEADLKTLSEWLATLKK